MKLSAFLAVSVPLLAMSQAPVMAQNAMADTGSWLKSSLSTLEPAAQPAAKPASRKVSHAMPAHSEPVVRMRAFVPGRYLPHESDLRQAMAAQQAQYDNSLAAAPTNSQQLSGEVNSNGYGAPRMVSNFDRSSMTNSLSQEPANRVAQPNKRGATRSPRVMPGQLPMVPEQLTAMQSPVTPLIPEPPMQKVATRPQFAMPMSPSMQSMQQEQQMMMQQLQQMQSPAARQSLMQQPLRQPAPMRTYMQPGYATANAPPQLTAQEQQALERMVAQNRPTAYMDFNGDIYGTTQDNPPSGTGPGPFPMNLLPGNAMQTLSQSHRPANVSEARFGSWHGNGSLPESGFHTYIRPHPTRFFECTLAPQVHSSSRKNTVRKSNKTTLAQTPSTARSPNREPSKRQSKAQPIMLATYPTYTSGHGLTY